jgi:predicted Zn-dependent peptidase
MIELENGAMENGVRYQKCKAPFGPFRFLVPDPVFLCDIIRRTKSHLDPYRETCQNTATIQFAQDPPLIEFQQISGPGGVPVYFQHLPVRSVSIYWLVFVGSADDEQVGNHGIYHWFEHIPSRGTKKYPGGYRDTEARLVRHGGSAGAETDYTHTAYFADVPKRVWTTALDILTDMIAQPLLRSQDIEAEREIIHQEIDQWHSSPSGESLCFLPSLLWPGHPLGHDQLGSPETLQSMNPSLLRRAHEQGYARCRCVLFVAGDLDRAEVLDEVSQAIEHLSQASLSRRHAPVSYGPLPPWNRGKCTIQPTRHADSIVYLLFPIPPMSESVDQFVFWSALEELITAGDLGSPLHRIIREESQLAYSPDFVCTTSADGGYWGLAAQTNCNNPRRIIDTFWDVLQSAELRSVDWYDFVTDTIRGGFDMHDPSPDEFTHEAAERLASYGCVWSDVELRKRLLDVKRHELAAFLDQLSPDDSHALIFQGRGAVS